MLKNVDFPLQIMYANMGIRHYMKISSKEIKLTGKEWFEHLLRSHELK